MRGRCRQAAVDKAVSVRGSYGEYRPHESPANGRITTGAGDAGGILAVVATKDRPPGRPPDSLSRPWPFKAVWNAVQATTRILDDQRSLTGETTAQVGLYVHWGQDKSKAC